MAVQIAIDKEKIAEFCRRHHIMKLSLFGSVLGSDFNDESDIDVLVEYDRKNIPDLLKVIAQEEELSSMFGRKVDLRTAEDLSRYFRNDVIRSAVAVYGE